MKNIWRFIFAIILLSACGNDGSSFPSEEPKQKDTSIKIMTFNMWHGGDAGKQPLAKSIETMCKAKAGIVGAQETHGYGNPRPDNSAQMAGSMGWRHVDQGHFDAVMTKYQIVEVTPSKNYSLYTNMGQKYDKKTP